MLEGKVRVVCGIEGEKYILHPGQQVSYLKNTGASYLTDANVEDVTAWQRGILVFRSVTVKDMMITLQRKYNITIQYNEAASTTTNTISASPKKQLFRKCLPL